MPTRTVTAKRSIGISVAKSAASSTKSKQNLHNKSITASTKRNSTKAPTDTNNRCSIVGLFYRSTILGLQTCFHPSKHTTQGFLLFQYRRVSIRFLAGLGCEKGTLQTLQTLYTLCCNILVPPSDFFQKGPIAVMKPGDLTQVDLFHACLDPSRIMKIGVELINHHTSELWYRLSSTGRSKKTGAKIDTKMINSLPMRWCFLSRRTRSN